jgi:molecular chaperone DnaK
MTGREQSVTIQGASTLSEGEVNRMLKEADLFAEKDRERRERVEKRNKAKSLTDTAQRRLKDVTLDFGSEFTRSYRRQVESLNAEILDSLEKNDERRLDRAQADLEDVLYELNREVRLQYEAEEEEGLFSSIRKTFTGEKEEDYPYPPKRSNLREDYRSTYNNSYYGSNSPVQDYRPGEPQNRRYDFDERERDYPNSRPYPRRDEADSPSYNSRRYQGNRAKNIPYENDWNDEDDDWF